MREQEHDDGCGHRVLKVVELPIEGWQRRLSCNKADRRITVENAENEVTTTVYDDNSAMVSFMRGSLRPFRKEWQVGGINRDSADVFTCVAKRVPWLDTIGEGNAMTALFRYLAIRCVLMASPVLAQEVTATIDGPAQVELGDLVILDASGSSAQRFHWILVNSEKTFLPVEQGRKLVFASGTPGQYTFVLVVGGADEKGDLVAEIAEHQVWVGNVVPPQPDPRPFQGFRHKIPPWATAVDARERPQQAREIASAFREHAPRAGSFASVAELTRSTSDSYKSRIGIDAYLQWRPVFEKVEKEIRDFQHMGVLVGVSDYEPLWLAIADGFEQVQP